MNNGYGIQPVIDYSYLVEVPITITPIAGNRIKFSDIPQLRDAVNKMKRVFTVGLEVLDSTSLTISPSGLTVVPSLTGLVLTLAIGSQEDIFQFPCSDLNPLNNSGLIRMLKDKIINWPNSYITILDATGLAINQAIVFNAFYNRRPNV